MTSSGLLQWFAVLVQVTDEELVKLFRLSTQGFRSPLSSVNGIQQSDADGIGVALDSVPGLAPNFVRAVDDDWDDGHLCLHRQVHRSLLEGLGGQEKDGSVGRCLSWR